MKIYALTAIAALALPFMAISQTTTDEQQTTTQGQTKETQTTAPAKAKKKRPAQEQRLNHRRSLRRAQMCADRRMFRVALGR